MFNPLPGTPAWYSATDAVRKASGLPRQFKIGYRARKKKAAILRAYAMRPELKYVDQNARSLSVVGVNGEVICLNSIGEGTEYNQRIGRLVHGRYIQMDIYATAPTDSSYQDSVTVALVYDRQPNNSTAAYNQVFDTSVIAIGQGFKQIALNSDRFRIVRTWTTGVLDHASSMDRARIRTFYKIPRAYNLTRYIGSGSGVPQTGAWLVVVASIANTASAVSSASVQITCRYAFNDA